MDCYLVAGGPAGGGLLSCGEQEIAGLSSVVGLSGIPPVRLRVCSTRFAGMSGQGRSVFSRENQAVDRNSVRFKARALVSFDTELDTTEKNVASLCNPMRAKVGIMKSFQDRQIFAKNGEISEENMQILVRELVGEDSRSTEDYRNRADMFERTAAFFKEGKEYLC